MTPSKVVASHPDRAFLFIQCTDDTTVPLHHGLDLKAASRNPRTELWIVPGCEHVKAFEYPVHVLRDPKHALVRLAQATVTPEAAIYDRGRALVYRGRIDNRYVSLGVERPAATEHDVEDVLTALAAGRPSPRSAAPAVGCFIADFVE